MKKSIITNDLDHCYECGSTYNLEKHHIFGKYNRNQSEEDGLFVKLCWNCHKKIHAEHSQKMMRAYYKIGQLAWEEHHPGESFLKVYGRNYIY